MPSEASLRPSFTRPSHASTRASAHAHTGNVAIFHMTGVPGQLPQPLILKRLIPKDSGCMLLAPGYSHWYI